MLQGLWAGCFLLAAFFQPLALASAGSASPTGEAYEENGNIFLKADGKATRLTDTMTCPNKLHLMVELLRDQCECN